MSDLPNELEFVSEDKLTAEQINAGLDNCSLKLWRTDADGKRWFKRLSILALPVQTQANLDDLSGCGIIRGIPQRKETPTT
jgi:hypothetical protein